MSGHLIALDKLPRVHPVGVGETSRQIFAKFVLEIMGPEATHACKYDYICLGLKAGIDGVVHGVQYIWDNNSTKENWVFLLFDSENVFNNINQIGLLLVIQHLWPSGAGFFN